MRPQLRHFGIAGLLAIVGGLAAKPVHADGYYYAPRSYYVAPPVVLDAFPVFSPAPIYVYEPVVVARPVSPAGYYYRLPAPAGRVRESWNVAPHRARYRYEYEFPNGVEYKYRYKRDGGYVRFSERWDD